MTKIILLLLSITLALCLSGGWRAVDANQLNSSAKRAVNAAVGHVKNKYTEVEAFQKVVQAEVQVVAGLNYRLLLKFGARKFQVIVWQQPAGYNGSNQEQFVVNESQELIGGDEDRILTRAGGWESLQIESLNGQAQVALETAVQHLKQLLGNNVAVLKQVNNAQRQVVAGANYKFRLVFTVGSQVREYEVTVWAKLDRTNEVTAVLEINEARVLPMTGGWTTINGNSLTGDASTALKAAIDKIEQVAGANNALLTVVKAETQVVAGINYRFNLRYLVNNQKVNFRVTVWHTLDGEFKVTGVQQL